jgi:hypothetical protein
MSHPSPYAEACAQLDAACAAGHPTAVAAAEDKFMEAARGLTANELIVQFEASVTSYIQAGQRLADCQGYMKDTQVRVHQLRCAHERSLLRKELLRRMPQPLTDIPDKVGR